MKRENWRQDFLASLVVFVLELSQQVMRPFIAAPCRQVCRSPTLGSARAVLQNRVENWDCTGVALNPVVIS